MQHLYTQVAQPQLWRGLSYILRPIKHSQKKERLTMTYCRLIKLIRNRSSDERFEVENGAQFQSRCFFHSISNRKQSCCMELRAQSTAITAAWRVLYLSWSFVGEKLHLLRAAHAQRPTLTHARLSVAVALHARNSRPKPAKTRHKYRRAAMFSN